MSETRQCQVVGHEMNNVMHICTYKDCALTSKWVCADCSLQQLHSHRQSNQNHIMKQKQFLEFTESQSQSIFDQSNQHTSLLQQCIKLLDQFVQSTIMFKKLLEQDSGRTNKLYKISELKNIIKIVNNDFLILQKHQIDLIINLKNNQSQFDFTLSQDLLKQVITQVQKLQLLIKVDNKQNIQEEIIQTQLVQSKIQQSQKNEQNYDFYQKFLQQQIKQEKGQIQIQQALQFGQQQISQAKEKQYRKVEYNNQKIYSDYFDFQSDSFIKAAQISEDEKYLAIGNDDCKLFVYDLDTKQLIQSLEVKQYVNICRFTKDSRYLVCGNVSQKYGRSLQLLQSKTLQFDAFFTRQGVIMACLYILMIAQPY